MSITVVNVNLLSMIRERKPGELLREPMCKTKDILVIATMMHLASLLLYARSGGFVCGYQNHGMLIWICVQSPRAGACAKTSPV